MSRRPTAGKRSGNLSQFGLIDIPDLDDGDEPMDISDDDVDLEAELAAISGGSKKPRNRKPAPVPVGELDAMIAASLKDIPSEDEGSGDDDDPDLLNELHALALDEEEAPAPPPRTSRPAPPPPGSNSSSIISVLQDRITNYTHAEKTAKEGGESSRARRFNRGLKTLNDLLKQAKSGVEINNEDIPPPVAVNKPAPPPESVDPPLSPLSPPSEPLAPLSDPPAIPPRSTSLPEEEPSVPEPTQPPPPPPDEKKQQDLNFILRRKEEFKAAALTAKQFGDKGLALELLRVMKQFDMVVAAHEAGEEMDLSELPTPQAITAAFKTQGESVQNSAAPSPPEPEEESPAFTATTIEEALKERLAAFQQLEAKAKEEGNTSKARRMSRIVAQYTSALRGVAAGRPPPPDLPPPPGAPPLPAPQGESSTPAPPSPSPSAAPPRPAARGSRSEKQLLLLLQRQKQYKEAALKAKKNGDIEKAKEYLRAAKGFDPMIEASKAGTVVDLMSIPAAPSEEPAPTENVERGFDVVTLADCSPEDQENLLSTDIDVRSRALQQLQAQARLAARAQATCAAAGDVARAGGFARLHAATAADADVLLLAPSNIMPNFHYETKQFTIEQCNPELNENDLELTIVRGIAYNVPNPKEVDTYVKFEFPYPQDAPVSDRTSLIKDTNSPHYDAIFPLTIARGNRGCLRVFKRHAIKLEVYSRGGWFSKDSLLGTVSVKLAPLETSVMIHDSFPLMDGRRPAGGSIEVKLRVRTPLLQPHVETSTHRWLVIDT